jgi:phenylalanine-4-hydroxylase
VGNVTYLRTRGPTQLAWKDSELYGHGIDYHGEGFGSPVGLLKDFSRCLSEYTFDELKAHRIIIGERVRLEFLSGVVVQGNLNAIVRQEHRNLLLSFDDCTVTALDGRVLFDPSWGCFDMAVGGAVESVFGGVADRERYRLYEALPATVARGQAPDAQLMDAYEFLADLSRDPQGIDDCAERVLAYFDSYPSEWLLRAEALRAAELVPALAVVCSRAVSELGSSLTEPQYQRALSFALPRYFAMDGADANRA